MSGKSVTIKPWFTNRDNLVYCEGTLSLNKDLKTTLNVNQKVAGVEGTQRGHGLYRLREGSGERRFCLHPNSSKPMNKFIRRRCS